MKYDLIIVADNDENNILKCLKSVEKLNFLQSELNVIVIDNNSKDNTLKKIRLYQRLKILRRKIFVFEQKEDAGLSNLYTLGSLFGSATYIIMATAKMIFEKDFIHDAERYFGAKTGAMKLVINGDTEDKSVFIYKRRALEAVRSSAFSIYDCDSDYYIFKHLEQKGFSTKYVCTSNKLF